MHRSIGYHLIQSYLPSILIVAISWVSFWMDIDCVPARVTLGVITLLTVSGLVSGNASLDIVIRLYLWLCKFSNAIIIEINPHLFLIQERKEVFHKRHT